MAEESGAESLDITEAFQGFDGDEVGPTDLSAKAQGEPAAGQDPAKAPPAQAQPGETQQAIDYREFITRNQRAGESYEDAATRLYANSRQGYQREQKERKEAQRTFQRLEQQLAEQNARFEPFLRQWYREQQMAAQQEAMAAIPDPETDPLGYQRFLLEEGLRRQNAAEEQRQAAEAEEQRLNGVAEADEAWAGELQEALANPNFEADFQMLVRHGIESARVDFPNATDEQLGQLIENANVLAMRQAIATGGVKNYVYQKAQILRRMSGVVQPPAPPSSAASPTARRLAAAAERGRKAGAMAGPGAPGQAGGMPGQGTDFLALSEDDFVKVGLSGKVDLNSLSKKKFGAELF